MGSSVLITLREGLEASLIISILLTYLTTTGRRPESGAVRAGTGAAIAACLVAMAVLTHMVFRMRAQARSPCAPSSRTSCRRSRATCAARLPPRPARSPHK